MTTSDLLTHILELMAQSITERAILDREYGSQTDESKKQFRYSFARIAGEIKAYQGLIKKLCLPTDSNPTSETSP